jgi:poly(A) polymerase
VATNATPEQVSLRRAFIIGRRFRIVHVIYGRGRHREHGDRVSTFRARGRQPGRVSWRQRAHQLKVSSTWVDTVDDRAGCCVTTSGAASEKTPRSDHHQRAMYYDEVVVDFWQHQRAEEKDHP